ncbi:YbjN domain-containing protein [uncultured Parasphingorhabdus sp.]|uniref:YbjN domain-containing protein n=1 Tax=uncultured Parasphingorhabdus sp. TaxID=2709694 RepID=UPI0030DD488A|tara:strand:- start:2056 stop:2562 length:507 start_codon:yes stop_codon:yes gene_type:complete
MLDDQWEQLDQDEAPPVDMLAAFFEARGWSVDRTGDDELSVEIKGNWTSYQMRAIWRNEDHVLQILLLPEIRVPEDKKAVIYETLGLINEQLWLGHFDLWSNNNILLFRHATLLGGSGMLGLDQAQTIVDLAIEEWERFYPVFQFVLWSDKSPQDAIAHAMVDTVGEA